MDQVEQYIKAAQDLRDLTRQAHEAIRDLGTVIKAAKVVKEQIPEDVALYLNKCAKEGMDAYSEAIGEAIEQGQNDIYKRFDKIQAILLGDEDKAKGGLNLEEQITAMIQSLSQVERKILAAKAKKILGTKLARLCLGYSLRSTEERGKQWSGKRYSTKTGSSVRFAAYWRRQNPWDRITRRARPARSGPTP